MNQEVKETKTLNNKEIFDMLYARILVNAKNGTLERESFKDLMKSSLQCAYSNGRVDVLYKETDNSLNDDN